MAFSNAELTHESSSATASEALTAVGGQAPQLPLIIASAGAGAQARFFESFAANIRNRHTRCASLLTGHVAEHPRAALRRKAKEGVPLRTDQWTP